MSRHEAKPEDRPRSPNHSCHTAGLDGVARSKGALSAAACIPARDEAATIGSVVTTCQAMVVAGVLDEVIVIDDSSTDATARIARQAGATVYPNRGGTGKGQALRSAVEHSAADILLFLDGDVTNFSELFVTGMLTPVFSDPDVQLVKARYRRLSPGVPGGGGRVTELVARPLLERFYPELADIAQPLAGESAVRRSALASIGLEDGYGIELGLLIDVFAQFGRRAIAEVDLGERSHRNRPLSDLTVHARDVMAAVLERRVAGYHPDGGGEATTVLDLRGIQPEGQPPDLVSRAISRVSRASPPGVLDIEQAAAMAVHMRGYGEQQVRQI